MQQSDRVLSVDLTQQNFSVSEMPPDVLRDLSAGRGYNIWHLLQYLTPMTDPCGPENILAFSCGLLTGTAAPVSARLHISGRSPQTGLLGSSNVGGNFGAGLRTSGYLSLTVRGRSPSPVLLVIEQSRLRFVPAKSWWGLDTWQTHQRIQNTFGPGAQALCIGPAGERMVPFACIMHGLDHAAGRTGLGAVMGSKNLKGIVITETPHSKKAGYSQINGCNRDFVRRVKQSPLYPNFSRHGGAGSVLWCNDLGIMPTRNYQENRFQEAEKIDGRLLEQFTQRRTRCYRCFIGCKAELKLPDERFPKGRATRPEFEPMVNFGARCGLSDISAVVHLDNLCSRLGLDCISSAGVLAFAMELFEKNILTLEDTAGLELEWGRAEAMEDMLHQIARQQGLGRILGQGVRKAAALIGRGAEAYAYEVKGLELSAYHPGMINGTALSYAISSRGGDFNTTYASLEYNWTREQALEAFGSKEAADLKGRQGKARMIKQAAIVNAALDSLGLCKIPTLSLLCDFSLKWEASLCRMVTGEDFTAERIFAIGERIINLERIFNCRQGCSGSEDTLQDFFFEKQGVRDDWLKPLVQEFYREMGWDHEGRPGQWANENPEDEDPAQSLPADKNRVS
ncbi:MAG: aldehyde ferredoxin oxidoreductase family protein [Desulfohalobiaceae bacterium]|nr:aldehyde ferredoxin oxidoreductase family protein [Desulfohalobiaceae bacterium]